MRLLEIQSSVREAGSISRALSREFISFEFVDQRIQTLFAVVNPVKLKNIRLN